LYNYQLEKLLEKILKKKTKLGLQVKNLVDNGEFVSDEIILSIISKRISEDDCNKGFILDGFPRNLNQAEKLSETLNEMSLVIDTVVDLVVDATEVINRLAGRSTCQDCGGMFHVQSCPPKVEGVCDNCGGSLAQRQDDNSETILKRLDVYQESTAPLKQFYKRQGNLKTVTARGSVEEIFSRVLEMVK
jgi:adenylate kinase